jgi:hypothetical protein
MMTYLLTKSPFSYHGRTGTVNKGAFTAMKQCFKCNVTKPLSEFHTHPKMRDGHLNKCKECARKDVATNRAARIDYYRAYDRERFQKDPERRADSMKRAKDRASENPNEQARAALAYRRKYPDKVAANNVVSNALRDGKIERGITCEVCGTDGSIHAHHPDYSQPLHVWWLCITCHAAIHRLQRKAQRNKNHPTTGPT